MLSLSLARKLKNAGLEWEPALHDMFAIPDRGLDDRRFVLTEVLAYTELFRDLAVVSFHGTAEWALDYILQTEAIWIPSETQLRRLIAHYATDLILEQKADGYECRAQHNGQRLSFSSSGACDAYGSALLQILWRQEGNPHLN